MSNGEDVRKEDHLSLSKKKKKKKATKKECPTVFNCQYLNRATATIDRLQTAIINIIMMIVIRIFFHRFFLIS
jgi:hypothetical protein